MKKLVYFLLVIMLLPLSVQAKSKVKVYIFTKAEEEYSQAAIEYFKELKEGELGEYFEYKTIEVWDADWQEDYDNRKIADKVVGYFDDVIYGAPYIVVGTKYNLPTFEEEYISEIEDAIEKAYEKKEFKDLVKQAKQEIKDKQKKDTISIISISTAVIVVLGAFIILARKNND